MTDTDLFLARGRLPGPDRRHPDEERRTLDRLRLTVAKELADRLVGGDRWAVRFVEERDADRDAYGGEVLTVRAEITRVREDTVIVRTYEMMPTGELFLTALREVRRRVVLAVKNLFRWPWRKDEFW